MYTEIEVTKLAEEERRKCCLLTGKKKKGCVVCVIPFERNCLLSYSFPVPIFPGPLNWQKSPHQHP